MYISQIMSPRNYAGHLRGNKAVKGYHGTVVAPQGDMTCAAPRLFAAPTPLPEFLLLLLAGPIFSRSITINC